MVMHNYTIFNLFEFIVTDLKITWLLNLFFNKTGKYCKNLIFFLEIN